MNHHHPQQPTSAPTEDALQRVRSAIARARAREGGAVEEVIAALAAVGAAGQAAESLAALRLLTAHPALLLQVDVGYRRPPWNGGVLRPDLAAGETDPAALVLAASHPSGRTREQAVRRMLDRPLPELLPFLVLRTSDWARPIQRLTCMELALLLHENPLLATPATVRTALLVGRRRRGTFAKDQLFAALAAPDGEVQASRSQVWDGGANRKRDQARATLAERLLAAPEPAVRRFALTAAVHRLRLRELAALAETDRDRRIRAQAAEAAARQAVWTDQGELLRRLARSRYPEVRIAALIGLLRTGAAADAVPHLDDSSATIRALARTAARRTGTDALAYYRSAVRAGAPQDGPPDGPYDSATGSAGATDAATGPAEAPHPASPAHPAPPQTAAPTPVPTPPADRAALAKLVGAIEGLAETGGQGDAPAFLALLAHPAAPVRVHALRALRGLGPVPVSPVVELLRDGSAAVVREAAIALAPHAEQLPAALLWELLGDPLRPAVRRAGYRLLYRRDRPAALRAALLLCADPHPRLAARATTDAVTQIRLMAPHAWRARQTVPLDADPAQAAELLALAEQRSAELTEPVVRLLSSVLHAAGDGPR
ncbi:hypothetical protein CFP65_1290 [Kitasatospora sp. MMS16-BH015]|uniref:HEAT repeat domain-containing protein n=1 Tax=Kitasatospora sp. MMS16-BH015 TaxID=2018025 RepID=UPI000CA2830F|nr:HEAT repeat domain-containing protein [Kitasatospora sp. MMS16-BH015]AUG76189.1 hypothetical protein CFP65_1290 [Kitasatospora sp. MMS16-BH015]